MILVKSHFIKSIAVVLSVVESISLSGCSDNENSRNINSDIQIEDSGNESSVVEESGTTSALNAYDTTKPIDTNTPPASSSSESSSNSEPTSTPSTATESKPEESKPTESSNSNTSSSSSSSSTPQSSSSSNSKPTQSSSTSTTTTKPIEKPTQSSSSSNSSSNSKPSVITIPAGAEGEYFDVNGNPMPSNFDSSNGGYYDRDGCYHMTPAELAEYNRQLREIANDPDSFFSQIDPDEFFGRN